MSIKLVPLLLVNLFVRGGVIICFPILHNVALKHQN